MTSERRRLRVLVVGAGAAGLVAARELRRERCAVTVIERRGDVGGLWHYGDAPSGPGPASPLYASLRTNLPRCLMAFRDFPFRAGRVHSAHHRESTGRRLSASLLALVATTTWVVFASAQTNTVRPRVVSSVPHDAAAFTQGLLWHEGVFFESTGLEGRSSVRRVDPETGEILDAMALPDDEFGEGLALIDDRLIQLTWQTGIAHVYDRESLREIDSFRYDGEGWGLCHDGTRLVMSDGSSFLFFRDPDDFSMLGRVQVTSNGTPLTRLNELECVGALVYANVWQTDIIVRIDPESGIVLTEIDASGLLENDEAASADVLNGIAFQPSTDRFFLTGKLWPRLFEVEFDFEPRGPRTATSPDAGAGSESNPRGGADQVDGSEPAPRSGTACASSRTSPTAPQSPAAALAAIAMVARLRRRRVTRTAKPAPERRRARREPPPTALRRSRRFWG